MIRCSWGLGYDKRGDGGHSERTRRVGLGLGIRDILAPGTAAQITDSPRDSAVRLDTLLTPARPARDPERDES